VQTDARRRGIATKLLRRAIKFLMERGVVELWLEVNLKNVQAVGLYAKLGFEKIQVLKDYYSDGSDAVRMRLNTEKSTKPTEDGDTS
jgi:ribosomal-protein-alanine N-acetyltransferase